MRVHQAVKHRVLWQRQLQFPASSFPLLFLQYLLISIHLLLLPTPSSSLLVPSLSLSTSILCSVKGNWGTAQYAKDYGGMLTRKERQTLTGHFHCVTPPHNNQGIGASFDFPTVWVSLLRQTTDSVTLCTFFISLSLVCAYLFPDSVRVTAGEFLC